MASPSLLRSAAGRVLRRSSPQGPFPWSPRVFFSGFARKIEPRKFPCSSPNPTQGERICWLEVLNQLEANLRATQKMVDIMVEQDKRSQKYEQLQKKIACVLLPVTAAVWIFGPDKKEKSSAEGKESL